MRQGLLCIFGIRIIYIAVLTMALVEMYQIR